MITKEEYISRRTTFMADYEKKARNWLKENQKMDTDLADIVPFFEDGVVCPDVWFDKSTAFRPLFIMKEVSIGKNGEDIEKDLNDYYSKWNRTNRFDHVGDPFGDIRIGVNQFGKTNNTWKRIVRLAYGLKYAFEEGNYPFLDYRQIQDLSFIQGDILNPNNTSGEPWYDYYTVNENYVNMVNQISVVNIKKIAGGTTVNSPLSISTGYFSEHLSDNFEELFYKQIVELIDPSVIIFCSPEISNLMRKKYNDTLVKEYVCIDGYHPTRTSVCKFYCKPVEEYIHKLGK